MIKEQEQRFADIAAIKTWAEDIAGAWNGDKPGAAEEQGCALRHCLRGRQPDIGAAFVSELRQGKITDRKSQFNKKARPLAKGTGPIVPSRLLWTLYL